MYVRFDLLGQIVSDYSIIILHDGYGEVHMFGCRLYIYSSFFFRTICFSRETSKAKALFFFFSSNGSSVSLMAKSNSVRLPNKVNNNLRFELLGNGKGKKEFWEPLVVFFKHNGFILD